MFLQPIDIIMRELFFGDILFPFVLASDIATLVRNRTSTNER